LSLSVIAHPQRETRCLTSWDRWWEGIEKFIIRQPPIGEKDDYDSENSWISDGLPSSSRRRRDGEPRDSKRRCDTMLDFA